MIRLDLSNGYHLKLLEMKDAAALFAQVDKNRKYLSAFLPWVDSTQSIADVENFISKKRELYSSNRGFTLGIWSDDQIVGCVELHEIDWDVGQSSVGYWIAEDFTGKGLATAATRAIVDYGFNNYGLNRIGLSAVAANRKSRAIAERLGFTLEGVLRQYVKLSDGQLADFAMYSVLASEWKQRN